ncbi:MAG TPA: response regulator [Rhodopila sp.]|jgi:CheY-like chemotaxis protein|nr:response regulator [Rhodopila sp.]
MFVPAPLLAGKRVLIVEDESLVAMLIEGLLEDCGCRIVGPCGTVEQALEAARTEAFDLAVLDVNLRGKKVYPVAEVLAERHIPFLFLSGYGEEAIPPGRTTWKVCAKPFKGNELMDMLSSALSSAVH